MLKGVPSPICWIHEWCGRPGRRRQPGPEQEPVLAAATCDNAWLAGMWSSSLTTRPNNGFCLLAMVSWTQDEGTELSTEDANRAASDREIWTRQSMMHQPWNQRVLIRVFKATVEDSTGYHYWLGLSKCQMCKTCFKPMLWKTASAK